MRKHDAASIAKALDAAWREYKQWFPTLGQLIELVEMAEKTQTVSERMRLTEGEAFEDPDAAQKIRDIVSGIAGEKGVE